MEEQAPAAPTISFGDIVMNVFASPSDAFEGIRTSPTRASTWVVPLILLMILSSIFTWMIFSNETMKNQVIDSQRERFQEQVQAGKMTQERADQAIEGMEKAGGMMIAFGIVGSVLMITITFFLAGLVFWLVGKFGLKAEGDYGKYLELWGATQWIGALGIIVTMLLAVAFASMYASPGGALAVLSNYNPKNTTHRLLSSINVFVIWEMVVAGIGSRSFQESPLAPVSGWGWACGSCGCSFPSSHCRPSACNTSLLPIRESPFQIPGITSYIVSIFRG
jgi:hypothetical protein